jgi:hypothetical protein
MQETLTVRWREDGMRSGRAPEWRDEFRTQVFKGKQAAQLN